MALIRDAQKRQQVIPAKSQEINSNSDAVTPEMQKNYDKLVMAGMKVIYDQSTHASIINMLRSGEPSEALANAVTTIILQLDKQSGGKIPEEIILPSSAELLGDLAELASKAGVFQVSEQIAAKAMQLLIISLGEHYGVDPKDVQQLMQSIPPDQIKAMVSQQSQFAGSPSAPSAAAQPAVPSAPAQPGG